MSPRKKLQPRRRHKRLTQARAAHLAGSYAEEIREYTGLLAEGGHYENMADFVWRNVESCQAENREQGSRVMHLDVGSGNGYLAEELIGQLRQKRLSFLLVLIELNRELVEESVNRIRATGVPVFPHIHSINPKRGRPERSFELHESAIRAVTPDASEAVVIIQDDLCRDMNILDALTDHLDRNDAYAGFDTLSFALPGTGNDVAFEGGNKLPESRAEVTKQQKELVDALRNAVCTQGNTYLKQYGSLCLINRRWEPSATELSPLSERGVPLEEAEMQFHVMTANQDLEGCNSRSAFELNGGAILSDNVRDIEQAASLGFVNVNKDTPTNLKRRIVGVSYYKK